MAKRRTTQDFIANARTVHGDKYDYSRTEYVGSKLKVEIVCPTHGPFWQRPNDHLSNRAGCVKCAHCGPRASLDDFIAKARAVHGDKYDYSRVDYRGVDSKIEIVCPQHGVFAQIPYDHINGHGCGKCATEKQVKARTWTTEQFVSKARARFGDTLDYSRAQYVTSLTPIEVGCPVHGFFTVRPHEHLKSTGCPLCASNAKKTHGELLARARAAHGDRYDYSKSTFTLVGAPVTITCKVHGDFQQIAKAHLNGHNCPLCAREATASQEENELAEWLVSLGVRVVRNDRTTLNGFELDIYLPDYRLGVEYHGSYWHHDERLQHPRIHEMKAARAESLGIGLVTVWDFDWQTKRALIQDMIRHRMGLSTGAKYHARQGAVAIVDKEIAADFYRRHHIQGAPNAARWHYGLRIGGALVACMSFGQGASRRGKLGNTEWELMRFAAHGMVRGAASKLFAAFVRAHAPATVWSYSDRQHFGGGLYRALGFAEDGRLEADYRVYHQRTGKLWHKSSWQRRYIPARLEELGIRATFDPDTDPRTERDMQRIAGVFRVRDAGKIRWKWGPCPMAVAA